MQQQQLTAFQQAFAQNGVISLENILPADLANELYEELNKLEWELQVKDYSANPRLEIPLKNIPNRKNLIEQLYSQDHEIDLNNLFYIRLALAEDKISSSTIEQVSNFMNSEMFIQTCKQITNIHDIDHAWIEATCYDSGCFLGNHQDDHHPGNKVAFILNMTREWRADWGGLLMIRRIIDAQPIIIPPGFNTLSLMKIPVDHCVSAVSQAAKNHRYSLTGWLRP